MNITKELREWLSNRAFLGNGYAELTAIADRIDERHKHAIGYVDDRDLDTMTENGWIRLPKDADGEYIRIGDKVETTNFGIVEVEGFVHRAVAFYDYSEEPAYLCTIPANLCHHYHAPTVEDVLRKFTDAILEWSGKSGTIAEVGTWSDVAAKYAAKLQLKED